MKPLFWLLAVGAFLLGAGLVRGGGTAVSPEHLKDLVERQEALFKDIRRIETASADILEIKKTRDAKIYTLSDEELGMERKGAMDLHIFMERFRNDTLEVLEFYERALGMRATDPLQAIFGKALDEAVTVDWQDRPLEEVIEELQRNYKCQIDVRGDLDQRLVITLYGEMSLRSILSQIEEVWNAKFVFEGGTLWLVAAP